MRRARKIFGLFSAWEEAFFVNAKDEHRTSNFEWKTDYARGCASHDKARGSYQVNEEK